MSDQVVLVNEEDEAVGLMQKLEAHQKDCGQTRVAATLFPKNRRITRR